MTRTPLIAGNWKMNGSFAAVSQICEHLSQNIPQGVDFAICPPFPYLSAAAEQLSSTPISWGAQDVSDHVGPGAFTGQVSATMLAEMGCRIVIVGHSERRALCHETDKIVAQKAAQVLKAGMQPIVCVGESLESYEAGQTLGVVTTQITALINGLEAAKIDNLEGIVLAYEPIWAIGTGLAATPDQAQSVHAAIRETLAKHWGDLANTVRILYGGSVKPNNARQLFAQADIDGGLIGGASLSAPDFIAIGEGAIG